MQRHSYTIFIAFCLLVSGCATGKKIKDGTTAYGQKQYAIAIEMLSEQVRGIEEGEEYARIAYLLGDSYKQLNDSENSLRWFVEAAKNNYGPDAFWELAYALKKNERYADAILSFRKLATFTDRQEEIRKEIEKCRKAQEWSQRNSEHQYIVEALTLNSDASDYAVNLLGEDMMVFTSDRLTDQDKVTYNWTGNAFSDLYISSIHDYFPQRLEGVNTEHNEGTAVFNQTGDIMYFTRCDSEIGDSYCKIYKSELENGSWTRGALAFEPKPNVNYRDPVLIENDSVLIFVADDPIGVGGADLYYSFMLDDGSWDVPDLMPTYLNSIGDERFPTWDGKTLYYSSDYFAGLGGLDIFSTTLNDDGSWSRPTNLLFPFNSSEDDYSYVVVPPSQLNPNEKAKYFFTSTRGVYGNDDIYEAIEYKSAEEMNTTPEPDTIATEEVVETKTYFIRVKVNEKIYAVSDNPNSLVVGRRGVPQVSIKLNDEILTSDNNGVIVKEIADAMSYNIVAGKSGYLNKKAVLNVTTEDMIDKPDGYVFDTEMEIERIYEGVEITLDNIYYDFNKDFIREDAKPPLNELITILNDNGNISIELASHTDCRGEDELNQDLSERRARSAINYIIGEGIASSRLTAVGYGATRPAIDCVCADCSEDEHQVNRRTTFSITRQ